MSNINRPMPDQTIGITKIVRAAKARKEMDKAMRMADAMRVANSMCETRHTIIMKK